MKPSQYIINISEGAFFLFTRLWIQQILQSGVNFLSNFPMKYNEIAYTPHDEISPLT